MIIYVQGGPDLIAPDKGFDEWIYFPKICPEQLLSNLKIQWVDWTKVDGQFEVHFLSDNGELYFVICTLCQDTYAVQSVVTGQRSDSLIPYHFLECIKLGGNDCLFLAQNDCNLSRDWKHKWSELNRSSEAHFRSFPEKDWKSDPYYWPKEDADLSRPVRAIIGIANREIHEEVLNFIRGGRCEALEKD